MKNFRAVAVRYHVPYAVYIVIAIALVALTFTSVSSDALRLFAFFFAWVPVLWGAIGALREKKIGSEIFFVIASGIALLGHEEQAMTIVLIVVLIAGYFERLMEERTERAIESLVKLIPTDVLVRTEDGEMTLPIGAVTLGMLVVVKTGFRIPVDGVVREGSASVNESFLTGESVLLEKKQGAIVYAGTFVESGSIIVETQKIGSKTVFGKIETLIAEAGNRKAKINVLADRITWILLPTLAVFIGTVWFFTRDIELIITLLVFGSPIELVLVTPMSILGGIVSGFKNGILIKGGLSLERLASADTIIFDKTGTLTIGEPRVVAIHVLDPQYTNEDVLRLSGIAEKRSGHPLAKAILMKANERGITLDEPEHYVSVSGHGVEMDYGGVHYFLGSKHFIEAQEHGNIAFDAVPAYENDHVLHTEFYLATRGGLCGMICVADEIRPDAQRTIEELKQGGIRTVLLLSGDRTEVAQQVASTLKIDKAYGEVMPDEKLAIIQKLQEEKHTVVMVGDGINDAPSLKQADIGIAMGAMGMEPAIEASDIALMSNDLSKIVFARALSKQTLRVIKQNIILGLGFTHGLGIVLALLGILHPVEAALFHAVPDLLILANSARLVRFKMPRIR